MPCAVDVSGPDDIPGRFATRQSPTIAEWPLVASLHLSPMEWHACCSSSWSGRAARHQRLLLVRPSAAMSGPCCAPSRRRWRRRVSPSPRLAVTSSSFRSLSWPAGRTAATRPRSPVSNDSERPSSPRSSGAPCRPIRSVHVGRHVLCCSQPGGRRGRDRPGRVERQLPDRAMSTSDCGSESVGRPHDSQPGAFNAVG